MSQYYDMSVEFHGYKPRRKNAVVKAANKEWAFDHTNWDQPSRHTILYGSGTGHLYGGESEEAFTRRLSMAVWKANGAYCEVRVNAACLEDPPTNQHMLTEKDYKKLTATVPKAKKPKRK